QIYIQQENIHLLKLEAFFKVYSRELTPAAAAALLAHWRAWNNGKDMRESWKALLEVLPELTKHAENWCRQQAAQINIAAALVQFHRNWVK
ncbi:MAG: elongation factor P maturation arginine rhamnosyltransferase EarP, partial [Gammaproteobacteria bacterium]|nr:elongation factor P maturation arginine rhamnosyltransferase EarP [Gammaproteobacteria bacterium]